MAGAVQLCFTRPLEGQTDLRRAGLEVFGLLSYMRQACCFTVLLLSQLSPPQLKTNLKPRSDQCRASFNLRVVVKHPVMRVRRDPTKFLAGLWSCIRVLLSCFLDSYYITTKPHKCRYFLPSLLDSPCLERVSSLRHIPQKILPYSIYIYIHTYIY